MHRQEYSVALVVRKYPPYDGILLTLCMAALAAAAGRSGSDGHGEGVKRLRLSSSTGAGGGGVCVKWRNHFENCLAT